MADFLVLRGAADPLPIKYKDMGDGSAAEVISASVSVGGVTVDPFAPNGNVASLAVSQTTANVALPAGVTVLVTNTGANKVYLKLSVGAGSAAITDMALQAGAAIGLKVGSNTFINAIADTGLTSSLRIAGGAGLPTGFGGGGTSGGGGGDASAANQTVVQGVIGAATAPTKMNVGGGVYNSSPITLTNGQSAALQMDANGYLNVNIKTGASSGAVSQGSTTSGQTGLLMQGAVTTGQPSYTTAQTSPLSLTTAGLLRVAVESQSGVAQGSTTSGQTGSPILARTLSTSPTDTTAQSNMPVLDLKGALLVQPYGHNDNGVSGVTAAMTGTTSTSLIPAPGSGLYNYITTIIVSNSHATIGTDVELQDGSGGTTFAVIPAAALYGGAAITLPKPLKQPTSNTALYVKNTTTGASTRVTAIGYKGP